MLSPKVFFRFALFVLIFCRIPFGFAQDSLAVNKAINRGIDDMMNSRYASALKTLSETREIAQTNSWPKQEFLSVNNIGLTYYKMGDYVKALNCFLQAYELAVSQRRPENEMTVLNNIALVYIKEEKKEKAEEYLLKAYTISVENKITIRIGFYASNLANLYLELNRLAEADKYLEIAFRTLDKNSRTLISARIVRNAIYLERNMPEKAVRDGLELLASIKDRGFDTETSEIQYFIAEAYLKLNQPEEALKFLENALKLKPEKDLRAKIFSLISNAAIKAKDFDKALWAKDSVIHLNKKISEEKNRELAENAALRFELSESRHTLENSKAEAADKQKIYLLSISLLLLILVSFTVIFYKRNQLSKQRKIIQENSLRIKNLELDHERQNTESLRHEIDVKNQILSDKILFQTTRNELIEEIIESLSDDPKISGNAVLFSSVRNLKSHLKDDAKWDDLSNHFENVNNEFIKALRERHPDLVANDIRYLSFVFLNLSTKEIASLLNITPESCRKRKERLFKKLNISAPDSLYSYLTSLV
ncbi:tetratricopeptide repeat protein [Flavobacterium sp.]|uniref:tetratricopeptide repeat protein n=1 Tax=Flavobacterium sp. TaxID=239 RepID=UPI0011FE9057|nr:tetratricopeptide repeat protein [Flavobacterium sp.]RZJ73891.1 MAG: tetratricopeptide repeat protein [Flavobacterium sp.]